MDSRGFTLIESLLAIAILGIALAGIMPAFLTFLDANTLSEERSDAVAAAQFVMERMRQQNPGTMPTTGASALELIAVGEREFEVQGFYCTDNAYCNTDSRHVVLEVNYGGQSVYSLETVFTKLR